MFFLSIFRFSEEKLQCSTGSGVDEEQIKESILLRVFKT